MKRFALIPLIAAGLMITSLGAQEIQKRKENQQDRIAQGVKSGELTAGETANLGALAWLFLRMAAEGELRQTLLEQGLDPRQVHRAVRYGRAHDLG